MAAGGFDTRFFAHMEEIDLCWRLQLMGGRIMYEPKSVVYHLGGASLDSSSPQKTFLNYRNNLLMLHKNLPAGGRKRNLLIRRRLLDTISMARLFLTGQFGHGAAIFKSHRAFSKMRKSYTEFPTKDLLGSVKRPNIVWDYFVCGRKTFR